MRERWVWRWSQGQRARRVRTSSANRCSSAATGSARRGDPEAGEVVGLERPIQVGPGHGRDRLVGEPEALEDRHLGTVVDGQLDVGQHQARCRTGPPGGGPSGRPPRPRSGGRRPAGRRRLTGSMPEAGPGQVEERQSRARSRPRRGGRRAAARPSARRPAASPARRRAPRRERRPPSPAAPPRRRRPRPGTRPRS